MVTMRILVAGSSGLIGTALVRTLLAGGWDVRKLVRREARDPGEYYWDPPSGRITDHAFDGVDAVVNLCGADISDGRWTHARKQVLLDSRIEPTEVLAAAVVEHGVPTLVNASAVSYYGDGGDTVLDESAPPGTGFLAELCARWEAATAPARDSGARVVMARSGLVLARAGLFGRLLPLFRVGLGGRLGDGSQYVPWISLPDHVAALAWTLREASVSGPVNLVGPEPVTNVAFTRALSSTLGRPAPWRMPRGALRAILGEFADEVALAGQRATPEVLRTHEFRFARARLPEALVTALELPDR